jgi:rhodanese-related sulfurtransferase
MCGLPVPIFKTYINMIAKELVKLKKTIIKEIIIIVFISITASLIYNSVSKQQISIIYHPFRIENDKQLTFSDIKRIHKNKEALFIDARTVEEYEEGHIPDAVNIPVGLERSKKMEMLNQLSKDLQIIVYCEDPQCSVAERLAKEMQYLKFKYIAVYEGGWDEWNSQINSDLDD